MPKKAVKRAAPTEPDAPQGVVTTVKTGDLESPPLVGFADHCAIIEGQLALEFVFYEVPGTTPLAVARFVLGIDDLLNMLWSSWEKFLHEVRPHYEAAGVQLPRIETTNPIGHHMSAAVQCNIVRFSRRGLHGLIDCHYVTARSVLQATQGKPLEVLPIMSLQVPTALLVAILAHLEDRIGHLRSLLPSTPGVV